MADRIDTVEARKKLKPRPAPYWHKLSNGCHLGFRKMSASSTGTWFAQFYDSGTRKQTRHRLDGVPDTIPAHLRFDAAKEAAELWFKHMGQGGSAETATVTDACVRYVEHVRAKKGDVPADDIESRFARWVYPAKIASIALPKLTRGHVKSWRENLKGTPVVVNPHAAVKVTRDRAPSSINRDMTALRAALNHAKDNSLVTTDAAWSVELRPIKNADNSRDVYLDREQRRGIIAAAQADIADLLRALAVLPIRPGALAGLNVSSLDKRLGVLTIGKDKAGRDRKIKLPANTLTFLLSQCRDKLPTAPLIARANGKAWDKDAWKKPVKAAVQAAGLPDGTTAYALRHSAITDLVTGGLDLLTVAQLSGTSVAMIEKHYGHFQRDHAAVALAGLAL